MHTSATEYATVFDNLGMLIGKTDSFDRTLAEAAEAVFALHTLEFQKLGNGHREGIEIAISLVVDKQPLS